MHIHNICPRLEVVWFQSRGNPEKRKPRHMGQQADRTKRHTSGGQLSCCIGKAPGSSREVPEEAN